MVSIFVRGQQELFKHFQYQQLLVPPEVLSCQVDGHPYGFVIGVAQAPDFTASDPEFFHDTKLAHKVSPVDLAFLPAGFNCLFPGMVNKGYVSE